MELEKGKAIVLRATVTPANATNKRVIWLSSDEDVIAVDTTGIVEGLEEGEADVIAVTSDGKHEARCSVTFTIGYETGSNCQRQLGRDCFRPGGES